MKYDLARRAYHRAREEEVQARADYRAAWTSYEVPQAEKDRLWEALEGASAAVVAALGAMTQARDSLSRAELAALVARQAQLNAPPPL